MLGLTLYAITSLGIALVGGAMARARQRIAGQIEELERMNAKLRVQVRLAAGREATPSAAIIDSQSVKTTEKGA